MIGNYLNQSVTIKSKTGYDKFGKPTTASSITAKARFQEKRKRMVAQGVEFFTDAILFLGANTTVNLDDVVTFESANYKVVEVASKRGFGGKVDHKEVLLVVTKE